MWPPPHSLLESINPPTCCFSPWSECCCLLKWLIFSLWVFLWLLLIFLHIQSFFITTIIRPFFYLALSAYFLPRSHCYHIHGYLYPLLRKYHHLWLSCLLPSPWRNIMLPMIIGCRHTHHNRMLHSFFRRHHYGGAVDHLSGCQKILCPPARSRWCSLDSIQKLACFPSASTYPSYLALRPWQLIILL